MSKNIKTLFTYDTLHSADSVEWCPIESYRNFFACGTYQHVDTANDTNGNGDKRIGSVTLFAVTGDKLLEKSRVITCGILDMKWCPKIVGDKIILAAANANGEICTYYLSDETLVTGTKISLKNESGDLLALSLDWSKSGDCDLICASDTKGNLTLLRLCGENLEILTDWNGHSLEAWITCFHASNNCVVFSGGDDAILRVWDTRSTNRSSGSTKEHTAGVTTLNFHPSKEHCLVSGSYDERIVVWDIRNWKMPSDSITVGGGLWRLKWSPKSDSPRYLLAACIYGGFEIVQIFDAPSRVAKYEEHDSLAYGADWCHLEESELFNRDQYMIATCSFYDKKLCVSLWDDNI